jgi:hypothetical protein
MIIGLRKHKKTLIVILIVALSALVISPFMPSHNFFVYPDISIAYKVYSQADQVFINHANQEAMDLGGDTCFGHQLEQNASEIGPKERVLESSVFIYVSKGDGLADTGTGFVVRNSSTLGDPHNKIITALHIVDILKENDNNSTASVFSSKGEYLGEFKLVAHNIYSLPHEVLSNVLENKSNNISIRTAVQPLVRVNASTRSLPDVAVLQWVPPVSFLYFYFYPDVRVFNSIRGLDISPVQANSYIRGDFGSSRTVGITSGFSGGAVIDAEGRVHGIISAGLGYDSVPIQSRNVRSNSMTLQMMPRYSQEMVHPLGDIAIRAALGQAGQGISESPNAPALVGNLSIWSVGFPQGGQCRVTAGDIGRHPHHLYIYDIPKPSM